jgi:hypothetical protein
MEESRKGNDIEKPSQTEINIEDVTFKTMVALETWIKWNLIADDIHIEQTNEYDIYKYTMNSRNETGYVKVDNAWRKLSDEEVMIFGNDQCACKGKMKEQDKRTIGTASLLFCYNDPTSLTSNFVAHFMNHKISHVAMIVPICVNSEVAQIESENHRYHNLTFTQYVWELGKNEDCDVLYKKGTKAQVDGRLTTLTSILKKRHTPMMIRNLKVNVNGFNNDVFAVAAAEITMMKRLYEYIAIHFGDEYDHFICSMYLKKYGLIAPMEPRFLFSKETEYEIERIRVPVSSCSMMVYETLHHMGVFLSERQSALVSPGDIWRELDIMMTPFFKYVDSFNL